MGLDEITKRERDSLEWHGVNDVQMTRILSSLCPDDLHTLFLAFHKTGYAAGKRDSDSGAYRERGYVDIGRDR